MATFTWTPSHPATADEMPKVKVAKFGDGYEQRQADGINNNLLKWSLNFTNRTLTEAAQIITFLRARAGVEAFDWTDPDGNAGKYVCRSWSRSLPYGNVRSITATFEQVAES
ncbi:MAG: phage tail protein [Alphaproteobacteria bacterium]|nr:phage tail protein [Alphaproteobacteria bacterium]